MENAEDVEDLSLFFANFDWRSYCKKYNLRSRIDAIGHYCLKMNFNIWIARLPADELKIKQVKEPLLLASKLQSAVDLRSKFPPCYDQGRLGSCVANALVAAYQYLAPSFFGSRLFLYYNQRVLSRNVKYDSGSYIRDGVKSLQQTGLAPETDWPYIASKFAQKPPTIAYTNALKHKVIKAYTVTQTVESMKALLVGGTPFVIGILAYNSFLSNQALNTGLVPMPPFGKNDRKIGGHSVLCMGFDDNVQCPNAPPGAWIFRNSWGPANGASGGYGTNGYGFLPYNYLTNKNLSSDNWYVKSTTN
jgi:C1A family cysteine protease